MKVKMKEIYAGRYRKRHITVMNMRRFIFTMFCRAFGNNSGNNIIRMEVCAYEASV